MLLPERSIPFSFPQTTPDCVKVFLSQEGSSDPLKRSQETACHCESPSWVGKKKALSGAEDRGGNFNGGIRTFNMLYFLHNGSAGLFGVMLEMGNTCPNLWYFTMSRSTTLNVVGLSRSEGESCFTVTQDPFHMWKFMTNIFMNS